MAIGLDGRDRKAIQVGEYPSTEMSCQWARAVEGRNSRLRPDWGNRPNYDLVYVKH